MEVTIQTCGLFCLGFFILVFLNQMYNLFNEGSIRVEDIDFSVLQVTMETSLFYKQTMFHRNEKFLFLASQKLPMIRAFHVLRTSRNLWWIGLFYPRFDQGEIK